MANHGHGGAAECRRQWEERGRRMTSVAVPSIDEDIWQDVWDEERAWREEGIDREQMPDPLALVIFGATGDLAHRKLVPALYSLAASTLLPEQLPVVGFARRWRWG